MKTSLVLSAALLDLVHIVAGLGISTPPVNTTLPIRGPFQLRVANATNAVIAASDLQASGGSFWLDREPSVACFPNSKGCNCAPNNTIQATTGVYIRKDETAWMDTDSEAQQQIFVDKDGELRYSTNEGEQMKLSRAFKVERESSSPSLPTRFSAPNKNPDSLEEISLEDIFFACPARSQGKLIYKVFGWNYGQTGCIRFVAEAIPVPKGASRPCQYT